MTITAMKFFGRKKLTDRERTMLKCANRAAETLFENRFSPALCNEWDVSANELTLEQVESDVMAAIFEKYNFSK